MKRHSLDWMGPNATLAYLAFGKLLLHLALANRYGYFRDELYYIAAGRHLAFGYVDFPPLIAWLAELVRITVGDSLIALRFLPALAGAAVVFLSGLIARELGGGRFAQGFTALAVLFTPVILGADINFTMDPFDQLAWVVALLLLAKIIRGGSPSLWIWFGATAGIGLLIKISFLYLGFAAVAGLLLTSHRKQFRNKEVYIGGAIAALCLLPYILWNAANGWPTAEFWANYHNKLNPVNPLEFLLQQILIISPFALPIWFGGLYFLFRSKEANWRPFGWMYLILLIIFMIQNAKNYFLAPFYPVLLAAGAVALERWASPPERIGWKRAAVSVILVGGILIAPMSQPLLPMDIQVNYFAVLGGANPKTEKWFTDIIPQHMGDRFGWPELADAMARAYHAIPEPDRGEACIFTSNYGEAGALDFYGPALGLPPVVSGHNNYYLWGYNGCSGDVILYLGREKPEQLQSLFVTVELVGSTHCTYCVWYENETPIYLCRGLRIPFDEVWAQAKNYQ